MIYGSGGYLGHVTLTHFNKFSLHYSKEPPSLARGKIFTASIGTVDSLYPSVFIYRVNLHQFLILCSSLCRMGIPCKFCDDFWRPISK